MSAFTQAAATPALALRHPARAAKFLSNALYLLKANAPPAVVLAYISQRMKRGPLARFRPAQAEFRASMASMRLCTDWFSDHIPFWLSAFEQYRLRAKPTLRALEIGSWEGLSTAFLLGCLDNTTITCVDTWAGSDEHQGHGPLDHVVRNFDANVSKFQSRVRKYKGTSFSYFNAKAGQEKFDLIYVDGSHHSDDVVIDAIKCFEQLEVGGLLIFDDYLWRYYERTEDNPAAAINAFLRLKKGCYKIVNVYWQLIIEKTAERRHR